MRRLRFALITLPALALAADATAQVTDRIARNVERRIEDRIVQIADDAVTCVLTDRACIERAEADGQPVILTDESGAILTNEAGNPVSDPDEAARQTEEAGSETWRNYDFVPGTRVIKVARMEGEPVGRFPANQLEYVRGTMQVARIDGDDWLEASSTSIVRLVLPEETGDSFSIEFRVLVPTANIGLTLYPAPRETAIRSYPHDYFSVSARPGVYRAGNELSAVYSPGIVKKPLQVRIQYDDGVLIMYVDSERVAMVPNANIPSSSVLEFHLEGNARFHTLLDDVVVALDVDDLYDALVNDGGFTTRGILFDFDSDRLRPESTPVLTELADALGRAAAMKVAILGHTDSQGADDYNRDLSERRAAAVMAWLVERGITADRLTAVGMGEAEPVASNDTQEGQAENRRVEIRVTE